VTGQKPSLGRIVLVPMDPNGNNGATCSPAIITRVWSDDTINVSVFGDSAASATVLRTSATFVDELPDTFTDAQTGEQRNVWCWPPRV
jgi:hypothetical protein